ncbi:hypothetical protein [Maricaulis sp.]|uniref:hypothetical protein n=1 Tax=Maricaulis sp. TaxID=1486257 RepID=UPI0025C5DF00|nr:hypothetical protein [Maricaulis sp.]
MTANEMIARYVQAVTRRLPLEQRADIGAELSALLTEELAGRAEGREPDAALARTLLQGFGHPETVALSYHQTPPVIETLDGRLFRKLAVIFLAALAVLALGVTLSDPAAQTDASFADRIADETLAAALQGLGGLLVVFWIAGFARRRWLRGRWSPNALPAVQAPDAVNRPVMAAAIMFWAAGLAILMAGPATVMAHITGGAAPTALLDAFTYDAAFAAERAPVLWVLLALSILVPAWQAVAGRVTRTTRRVEAVLTLLLAAALFRIVLAGDVFAAEPANEYMKLAMALFGGWGVITSLTALHRDWQTRRSEAAASAPPAQE